MVWSSKVETCVELYLHGSCPYSLGKFFTCLNIKYVSQDELQKQKLIKYDIDGDDDNEEVGYIPVLWARNSVVCSALQL